MNEAERAALKQIIDGANALLAASGAAPPPPQPEAPPGYVKMAVTGHILPLPIDADVSTWGYLLRAGAAAGGTPYQRSMRLANAMYAISGDDRSKWPEALDRVLNQDAYSTPEEIARRKREEEEAAAAPFLSGGHG